MLGIEKIRNIGISAHIDSGKTTLTERILFYTKRIHAIHDVKGRDGVGAKMDSMDLERERGITIQSAATHCVWAGSHINIIDTPGHVDFTVEVERALRVLDGAILVLCSVAGVQSQSLTVDRQMRRYRVPRIAFINKCDRSGANPLRVKQQLREKLGLNPVLLQLPLGLEGAFDGVIDLVRQVALRFEGDAGESVVEGPIPPALQGEVDTARAEMLDALSMFSDELTEAILDESPVGDSAASRVTEELVHRVIREATLKLQIAPVMLGSAYKNKGVQPLLDAITRYLPAPDDVVNEAVDPEHEGDKIVVSSDPAGPLVMLAFKLEDGRFGQLTYLRVYQGKLARGLEITNSRTHKTHRVGRLVRMHADEMEEIESAASGDIVAMFGIDCNSGDTFTDGRVALAMTSMHVPDPVISLTVTPKDSKGQVNLSKALRRFAKEDPTFRVGADPETGETIISGMGELHLDVYVQRMKREYSAEVVVSPPRVAYRETITRRVEYQYTHKKQTGGSGQFGRVAGAIEPLQTQAYEFVDEVVGGAVPREFITSVDKGFRSMLAKGPLIHAPVVGLRVILDDGQSHAVDSSDIAFQEAARGAFREAYHRAAPQILEPVMKVAVEGPSEFHGAVTGTLLQRRGLIIGATEADGFSRVEAEVPLADMFGFSTVLRSASQGKAEFTMEFSRYAPVPASVAQELLEAHRNALAGKGK